jgi:glutathione S-transferase
MKLIGSKTSPYVRKVRVILAEKQLPFEFVEENVWAADTKMAQFNPLVKVPALLLDDGEPVYDSVAIAEYLDALPGGAKFIPADPRERALVRREEALGDGISDAGILMRLERQRDAARQDPGWIARQQSKVEAGVAAASRMVATHKPGSITLGDIALACALLWVDFRMPEVGWRKDAALKAWIERLESRPSFANTRPG